MNLELIISSTGISLGAVVMLVSIVKFRSIFSAVSFVPEQRRGQFLRAFKIHRALMVLFFLGYLVVLISFIFDVVLVGRVFVSIIFFFGAVFVLAGISIQSWLFHEIQSTLRGLLPICAKCKKIRADGADAKIQSSWKRLEEYISAKVDVDFTHGLCPACMQEELKELQKLRNS